MAMQIPLVIALWEHVGYQGRRRTVVYDTPNLTSQGFNDKVSAVGVHPGPDYETWKAAHAGAEPTVGLYEHAGYGGAALILEAGAYANIHLLHNFGDVVSSVRLNPPHSQAAKIAPIPLVVELYKDASFTGDRVVVVEDIPNVIDYLGSDWNDVLTAVRVMQGPNYAAGKVARLFRDVDYKGGSVDLAPGDYPNLGASHGLNDVVSSVRVR